ncbi:MAG: GIY-YIG nuclease family protein [Desulfobacterales bacterium]|nr:MAG: GIY-YIG nuclease family protein [Desulfobacterales bacterium]
MEHWVYIIQSQSIGRYYCGQTRDLLTRVGQHNDPTNDLSRTTKPFRGPWELMWSRQFESGSESVRLERRIKKRGIERSFTGSYPACRCSTHKSQRDDAWHRHSMPCFFD